MSASPFQSYGAIIGDHAYATTLENGLTGPTVLGPGSLSFGSDSSVSHPAPSELKLDLFIPDTLAIGRPAMGEPVQLSGLTAEGAEIVMFGGTIEDIEIKQMMASENISWIDDKDLSPGPGYRKEDPGWFSSPAQWRARWDDGGLSEWTDIATGAHRDMHHAPVWVHTEENPLATDVQMPEFPAPIGKTVRYSFTLQHPLAAVSIDIDGRRIWAFPSPWDTFSDNNLWLSRNYLSEPITFQGSPRQVRPRLSLAPLLEATDIGTPRAAIGHWMQWISPSGPQSDQAWWRMMKPRGVWKSITARDAKAAAARERVTLPRIDLGPASVAVQALSEISSAVAYVGSSAGTATTLTASVGPIVEDDVSPLEVFERVSMTEARPVVADPDIIHRRYAGMLPVIRNSVDPMMLSTLAVDGDVLVVIPGIIPEIGVHQIENVPLRSSIEDIETVGSVTHRWTIVGADPEYEDMTLRRSNPSGVTKFGPVERTYQTYSGSVLTQESAARSPLPPRLERSILDRLRAQDQPRFAGPLAVRLGASTAAEREFLATLYNPVTALGALVQIGKSERDFPARHGASTLQRVIGVEATFGARPSLSLTVEPAEMTPGAAVTFLDVIELPEGHPVRSAPVGASSITFTDLITTGPPIT